MRHHVLTLPLVVIIGLAGVSLAAKTTFSAVWKSPDAAKFAFGGQKVAAVVIDQDESLRVSGEELLTEELIKRGMQGVPSYRMVPKELLKKPEEARAWLEKSGVQAVIAFRLISDDQVRTITPATWSSAYYQTFGGYYSYGWGVAFTTGSDRTDRFVSLEALIFSVPANKLLWAGVSHSDNPKNAKAVVEEVVKAAAEEMQKQGLAGKGRSK